MSVASNSAADLRPFCGFQMNNDATLRVSSAQPVIEITRRGTRKVLKRF